MKLLFATLACFLLTLEGWSQSGKTAPVMGAAAVGVVKQDSVSSKSTGPDRPKNELKASATSALSGNQGVPEKKIPAKNELAPSGKTHILD